MKIMAYTFNTDNNHTWTVGDIPSVYGTVQGNERTLEGVTVTLTLTRAIEQTESFSSTTSGSFNLILQPFTQPDGGRIFVKALEGSGATFTLNGSISASDLTATVDGESGDVPASGYCRIDDEWMQYSKSGVTVTFQRRGIWNTTAASHNDDTVVRTVDNITTLIPYYEWQCYDPSLLPEGV